MDVSDKVKSVLDYISRAELTEHETGELIGALMVKTIGGAVTDALKELDI